METVLEVYKEPYDEKQPVVCMDESSKQHVEGSAQEIANGAGEAGTLRYGI